MYAASRHSLCLEEPFRAAFFSTAHRSLQGSCHEMQCAFQKHMEQAHYGFSPRVELYIGDQLETGSQE